MKKLLRLLLGIIIVLIFAVGVYVAYVLLTYYRLDDHLELSVSGPAVAVEEQLVQTDTQYSIVSHNIGFGAYTPEFSFFMDGGEYSRAFSEEAVIDTVNSAISLDFSKDSEFVLVQEIDTDSDRDRHVDEWELYLTAKPEYYSIFAQNYDSPYLFYPFTSPHGASKSGIGTFSTFEPTGSERRSLPISKGVSKFVDLDRCYSVTRYQVANGKELCVYNVHLTAYTSDESVRTGQKQMLCDDMKAEVAAGNYVVCGGDFNHDLELENDDAALASWAHSFDRSLLGDQLHFAFDELSSEEQAALQKSCRNADEPYIEGHTTTVTVDGFIISDNVELVLYTVVGTGYQYSDHDPVYMEFILK